MGNGEDAALDHRMRRIVYNYISENPGVAFGRIKKMLEMNASTLKYHLRYLEKSNKVFSQKEGKKRCYFCEERPGFDLDPMSGIDLDSLSKKQQRLLGLIRSNPGITRKDLLSNLNIDRKALTRDLRKLQDKKIVLKVDKGYEYITNERLKEMIYKRLLMRLLNDEIDEEQFKAVKRKLESLEAARDAEF